MSAVETEILNLVEAEKCSEMKNIFLQLANRDSLRQSIPAIVKNLINQGEKGGDAFNESNSGQDVVWSASYTAEISKKGMILKIGYGSNDPICFLVYNLCSRLMGFLDQSWILPTGVEWQIKRPRNVSVSAAHDTV